MAGKPLAQQQRSSQTEERQVADAELKKLHQLLITNYVRILGEVSGLRAFGGRGYRNEQWGGDWSVTRVFVRMFCEAHIRRQLTALTRVVQLQEGLMDCRNEGNPVLQEIRQSSERILSAIPSRQRVKLFLATASPVALGLVVAAVGAENAYTAAVRIASPEFRASIGSSATASLFFLYFLLAGVYLLTFFAGSFAYARGLFFPAVRYREASRRGKRLLDMHRQLRGLDKPSDGVNVYAIENNLFAELRFTKPKEPMIDIFIVTLLVVTGLLAWGLYVATGGRNDDALAIVTASVVLAFIGGAALVRVLQVARHREWR